ncbi:hypothetical protein Tco_0964120, partial [Tanacetum coccineum]
VKAISMSQSTSKTLDRGLLDLEDQINFLLKGPQPAPKASSTHVPQVYVEAVSSNLHSRNLDEPPRPGEEEKSAKDNVMSGNSIVKPNGSDVVVPLKEVEKENEPENESKNEPVESVEKKLTQIKEEELVEAPSSQSDREANQERHRANSPHYDRQ